MILCAGEALFDLIPDQDGRLRPVAGGSCFNTAIALGRQGADVSFMWPLSVDNLGQQLRAALDQSHVRRDLCPNSDAPSPLALVSLHGGDAQYAFYLTGTAADDVRPAPWPDGARVLFSGGLALILPDSAKVVADMMALAPLSMLDLNIRPSVPHDGGYRARLIDMARRADIVKASAEDLAWLSPDMGADAAAEALAQAGPIILQSRGADGVRAIGPWGVIAHPAQRVEVADTIGAGDSFNAGFLAHLARACALSRAGLTRKAVSQAVQHGIATAAITCTRHGANPPWAEELAGGPDCGGI